MAGDLTRAWHKGNRPVEKVAFLAHRAIPVVNGLKIGGLTTLPSLSTRLNISLSLAQLNPTLYPLLLRERDIPRLWDVHLPP